MIENQAKQVLIELIGDNVLGCRSLLSVCTIHFSREIDTAAVTLGNRPRLRINPDFLAQKAPSPDDMRVVILHEFLHVMLRHTQQFKRMTPLMNFVLDLQVNSFLGRQFPRKTLGLLHRLYGDERGPFRLLAPPDAASRIQLPTNLTEVHEQLYQPCVRFSWSDLYELFKAPLKQIPADAKPLYLGHHPDQIPEDERPTANQLNRLESSLEDFGRQHRGAQELIERTVQVRHIAGSIDHAFNRLSGMLKQKSETHQEPEALVPVLQSGDRRAAMRAVWSPILPSSAQPSPKKRPLIRVYLDVSGSMSGELPEIINILHRHRNRIAPPLRAFSTVVIPASWSAKGLVYKTRIGTDLNCVFEDLRQDPAAGAMIFTDGYFEPVLDEPPCPLYGVVSRFGTSYHLQQMNVSTTQLH